MGSHREKLVLGKNGSLGPKWTHLIRVTLEEEGGAEGGGWGGGFLAGGRFLHWREGGVWGPAGDLQLGYPVIIQFFFDIFHSMTVL